METENKDKSRVEIRPDVLTPGSVAHLVDARNDVVLLHGGSVTRIGFDRVEQATVEWFIAHAAEVLGSSDRRLTLLRDSVSGTYATILGDQVLMYHVTEVGECFLDDVLQRLRNKDELSLSFDLPYPLVSYVRASNSKEVVTVELPAACRQFKSTTMKVDLALYLPPMWFSAVFNAAGAMMHARVAVVPERARTRKATKLYHLPLPNNSMDGVICFGTTSFVGDVSAAGNGLGARMQAAIDRFFLSDWNNDLLTIPLLDAVAQPDIPDRIAEMLNDSMAYTRMRQLLRILSVPNGWQRVPYNRLSCDAEAFTACANL